MLFSIVDAYIRTFCGSKHGSLIFYNHFTHFKHGHFAEAKKDTTNHFTLPSRESRAWIRCRPQITITIFPWHRFAALDSFEDKQNRILSPDWRALYGHLGRIVWSADWYIYVMLIALVDIYKRIVLSADWYRNSQHKQKTETYNLHRPIYLTVWKKWSMAKFNLCRSSHSFFVLFMVVISQQKRRILKTCNLNVYLRAMRRCISVMNEVEVILGKSGSGAHIPSG